LHVERKQCAATNQLPLNKDKKHSFYCILILPWLKQISAKERFYLIFVAFKQLSSFWQGLPEVSFEDDL